MAKSSKSPNVDFGSPIIFFDTHPQEQESYIYGFYSSLRTQLKTAWTGIPPKPLLPGKLRIVWWTDDNKEGFKDFELHEHRLIKADFDSLRDLPEVRRVLVTGFSGQNPYFLAQDTTPGPAGSGDVEGYSHAFESVMDRKLRQEQESMRKWAERGRETELGPVNIEKVFERQDQLQQQNDLLAKESSEHLDV